MACNTLPEQHTSFAFYVQIAMVLASSEPGGGAPDEAAMRLLNRLLKHALETLTSPQLAKREVAIAARAVGELAPATRLFHGGDVVSVTADSWDLGTAFTGWGRCESSRVEATGWAGAVTTSHRPRHIAPVTRPYSGTCSRATQ